jgi:hypothetical protein
VGMLLPVLRPLRCRGFPRIRLLHDPLGWRPGVLNAALFGQLLPHLLRDALLGQPRLLSARLFLRPLLLDGLRLCRLRLLHNPALWRPHPFNAPQFQRLHLLSALRLCQPHLLRDPPPWWQRPFNARQLRQLHRLRRLQAPYRLATRAWLRRSPPFLKI